MDIVSEKQPIDLASYYRNPEVRLYALKAIKQKQISIPEHITLAFSKDKCRVNTLSGCVGGNATVSSIAKKILAPGKSISY